MKKNKKIVRCIKCGVKVDIDKIKLKNPPTCDLCLYK